MENIKCLIFSHESDIDGLGCVVLAKLAFNDLRYILEHNTTSLEPVVRDFYEVGLLDYYDKIFITDLALEEPTLSVIANSEISKKIQVLDHHQRAINLNLNKYPFTKIVEEDTKKRCATDLFYEYLVNNNYLERTKALDDFVESTRLEDTWTWKEQDDFGNRAHDLAVLLNEIGKKEYINSMTKKLSTEKEFDLTTDEKLKIALNKEETKEYIENKILPNIKYMTDEDNNKFGIVFSKYQYRNEIADYIIEHNNPNNIKYIIIAAMDKGANGQKSYRSIEDNFDVNKIAMKHGGGGHPGAALVNITEEQKKKVKTLKQNESLEYLAKASYNK